MANNQLITPEYIKGLLKEVIFYAIRVSYLTDGKGRTVVNDKRLLDDSLVIEVEIGDRNVSVTVTINHNDSTRDKKAIK